MHSELVDAEPDVEPEPTREQTSSRVELPPGVLGPESPLYKNLDAGLTLVFEAFVADDDVSQELIEQVKVFSRDADKRGRRQFVLSRVFLRRNAPRLRIHHCNRRPRAREPRTTRRVARTCGSRGDPHPPGDDDDEHVVLRRRLGVAA